MTALARRVAVGCCLMGLALLPVQATEAANNSEIVIPGAPDHGIFDPSIAQDENGRFYMAVSGVASTAAGRSLGALAVRTLIAVSNDLGKSWQFLETVVNSDIEVNLDDFAAPHHGRWQSEVSALLFDPYAPTAARWKLFWHQYLNINGDWRFEQGWLAYKAAARPEELVSAHAVKLFTARGYTDRDNDAASPTKPPIAGGAVERIQRIHKDLSRCAAVSEPGTLAKEDADYLVMVCFEGSVLEIFGVNNRIVLLRCARPCRADIPGAWSYVGTLLSPEDGERLSIRKFSAAELFSDGRRNLLIVSPIGTAPGEGAYKGCAVFQIEDLNRAAVVRDSGGKPVIQTFIRLEEASFNGACTVVDRHSRRGRHRTS